MFYKMQIRDYIRIPPSFLDKDIEDAVIQRIKKKYEGQITKDLGIIIDVASILKIEEGVLIHGDGAPYYKTEFELLTFIPELQEIVIGKIRDIADFGAFINLGPIEGMIHISQTMDDFVSFSKDKVLIGKESKKVLRVGDKCRARIIAISFKDLSNPKLGLTMRQEGLGKEEWFVEDKEKKKGGKK